MNQTPLGCRSIIHHFFRSCTGWEASSGSSSSSQCSSSAAWTAWPRRTYPVIYHACQTWWLVDVCVRHQRRRSSSLRHALPPPVTALSPYVAAARIWNSLPTSLTSSASLASFRRQLKTELFVLSFPDLDSSAYDRIRQILCSYFRVAVALAFVTVFSVCLFLQSFDITPPNENSNKNSKFQFSVTKILVFTQYFTKKHFPVIQLWA